jgi:hypothetical protein
VFTYSHWKIISHCYQNVLVEYRSKNQTEFGGKSKYDVKNTRQEICSDVKKKSHTRTPDLFSLMDLLFKPRVSCLPIMHSTSWVTPPKRVLLKRKLELHCEKNLYLRKNVFLIFCYNNFFLFLCIHEVNMIEYLIWSNTI